MVFALLFWTSARAEAQVSHQDWGFTLQGGGHLVTGEGPFAVGPTLGLAANYGVHPMWNVGAELMLATPIPTSAGVEFSVVGGAFAGVSTVFDVLKIVPWLRLSGGVLLERLPETLVGSDLVTMGPYVANPALMLSLGVDIRKKRASSWGIQADVIAAGRPEWQWARHVRLAARFTWMRSRSAI